VRTRLMYAAGAVVAAAALAVYILVFLHPYP
jgi:hypothetical protein